jgi:hypothetical protein
LHFRQPCPPRRPRRGIRSGSDLDPVAIGSRSDRDRVAIPIEIGCDPAVVHVLNRIAFGARPGDVERVQKLGLQRYIDEQLHPERIADADMAGRLKDLTTVGLSSREIQEMYERPAMQARRERKQNDADPTPEMRELQRKARSVIDELGEQKILRAVYSGRQLEEVSPTSGSTTSTSTPARAGRARSSPNTSATQSGRTCSAGSATCSARPRRARRCCSISTTG